MISPRLEKWIFSHEEMLWWAGTLSLGMLILGVILLPVVVIGLPQDYLSSGAQNPQRRSARRTLRGRICRVGRNAAGALLVLAGIALMLMPGQGLVSIAVGLGLMDFPGKRGLLRRVARRRGALRAVNRLRGRFGRPPLTAPEQRPE